VGTLSNLVQMSYKNILDKLKKGDVRKLNDHVLLIDGMNMFIRNFAMVKTLDPSGNHVGGIQGFLKSLGAMVSQFDPTRVICVFDGKGSTVNRKNIDPNYKAQRPTTRITKWGLFESKEQEMESIRGQVDRLQDYLRCLPVSVIEIEKCEADDVIALLCQEYASRGRKSTIISTDKDFLQLVRTGVEVYNPIKKELATPSNILEVLQVHPKNYNLVKAVVGDVSDNLRGVKGLGLKTLIKEYPELITDPTVTLKRIYEIAESRLDSKKIYANLIFEWDLVLRNMSIMDLQDTMMSDYDVEQVLEGLSTPNLKLHVGAFIRLLEMDSIQAPSNNVDSWLQRFIDLTIYTADQKSNKSLING
jgi:5'-3' exonuclease